MSYRGLRKMEKHTSCEEIIYPANVEKRNENVCKYILVEPQAEKPRVSLIHDVLITL